MDLVQVNKRRRVTRREQEITTDIEEVIEAAQGLKDVMSIIKELTGYAHSTLKTTLSLSEAEVASLKAAFCCLVCKGPLDKPMFSTCCRSLIGCKTYILEWMKSSSHCLNCRAADVEGSILEVAGLCEALAPLHKLFHY
ncbi:uncharacterized protein LOC144021181 [Festucalex cinctus]